MYMALQKDTLVQHSQHEADGYTCCLCGRHACWQSAQKVGQPTYALQPSQQVRVVDIKIAETGHDLAGSLGFFSSLIQNGQRQWQRPFTKKEKLLLMGKRTTKALVSHCLSVNP